MVPINCPSCQTEILRSKIELHKSQDCPEEIVPCTFYNQGCLLKVNKKNFFLFEIILKLTRKLLPNHLKENVNFHLNLFKVTFENQIKYLTEFFESELKVI